jgi:hypothetical protein
MNIKTYMVLAVAALTAACNQAETEVPVDAPATEAPATDAPAADAPAVVTDGANLSDASVDGNKIAPREVKE